MPYGKIRVRYWAACEVVEMSTTDQMVKLLTVHPNMTYQEIGEIAGCSRQRVHQVASRAGLTKKSRLYRTDVTMDRVLELYYHSNLLVQDIARLLGCHENTITNRLRAAGVSPSKSYSRRQKLYWRRLNRNSHKTRPSPSCYAHNKRCSSPPVSSYRHLHLLDL